jgi:hypothetical protein
VDVGSAFKALKRKLSLSLLTGRAPPLK